LVSILHTYSFYLLFIYYLFIYLFISNTSYYVEVENGALLHDVMQ